MATIRRNKETLIVRETKSLKETLHHAKTCECCEKRFISTRVTAKYCSEKCRVKYARLAKQRILEEEKQIKELEELIQRKMQEYRIKRKIREERKLIKEQK